MTCEHGSHPPKYPVDPPGRTGCPKPLLKAGAPHNVGSSIAFNDQKDRAGGDWRILGGTLGLASLKSMR